MSGYSHPPPNSNLIQGYPSQTAPYPVHSSGLPSAPGHAPQPPSGPFTHPGFFGNGMYPSPLGTAAAPYAPNNPPLAYSNLPHVTTQPSPPELPSKRPLPTPAARPASVIYPPQTMPHPPPSMQTPPIIPAGMPVHHQRSMTFDPSAYNAMVLAAAGGQGPGLVHLPSTVNSSVGFRAPAGAAGARPASIHALPPGWNPHPSPVVPPVALAPSSFGGPSVPKKEADLPPLPPPSNAIPPPTQGSGVVPGKKALPTAPGNANGISINMAALPAGWNPFPAAASSGPMWPSASSPSDKRPLPTPSQSLPRISTILTNGPSPLPVGGTIASTPITPGTNSMPASLSSVGNEGGAAATGAVPAPSSSSSSSPTKRALPTAPGGGGIQPGKIPLPTSPPTSAPASIATPPPPTSVPSSYASARSTASSSSGFTTAPSSFTGARPSSVSSPSPPPTGAPRSTASDTSGVEVDKRPLWKRMAANHASSRPTSVFGHRREGGGSVGDGGGAEDKNTMEKPSRSGQRQQNGKPEVVMKRGDAPPNSPTSWPMEHQGTSTVESAPPSANRIVPERGTTVPLPSPASRSTPLPTPPSTAPTTAATTTPAVAASGAKKEKTEERTDEPVPSLPRGIQPTPIVPYQPKSRPAKGKQLPPTEATTTPLPKKREPERQAVASTTSTPKVPAVAQPSPIVPYQPKPPKQVKEPVQAPPQPQHANAGISTTGSGGKAVTGKVRFSTDPPNGHPFHPVQPNTSRSPPRAAVASASPPRASAMKGKGTKKSPPRAEASAVDSAAVPSHSHSNQQQPQQPQSPPHPQISPTTVTATAAAAAASPQISMALRFASMDIQNEARATQKDWAKWALVSSHDVATKPVPLNGVVAPPTSASPPENVRRRDSGRRRSASAGGAPMASLEDPPPPPAMARRGSFDEVAATTAAVDAATSVAKTTEALIQSAAANGGMRRGGARPMPGSASSSSMSKGPQVNQPAAVSKAGGPPTHVRSPSEEPYPQYKPSYTDSDSDSEEDTNPRITVSTAPPPLPQISISSPGDVPSICIEDEAADDVDPPAISITADEPETSAKGDGGIPTFSFDGPEDEEGGSPGGGERGGGGGKKRKHRREKSVKEEEDERERARQLAKTRPLPPKIKKGGARCGKCDRPILGRAVSAMDARWHPECFRCSVCETFLEHVSSYEHDDRPYCHLDYHELFAPRCYHCQTPIMEEHFITLDDEALGKRTYHEQHFFCAECGDPFLAPKQERRTRQLDNGTLEILDQEDEVGFTVYKGHPYCEACHVRLRMPKCKRCKKSIRPGDQAIEALGSKWCWSCFTCDRCSKPFEASHFYEHGKKPYCQRCYGILLVNQLD